MGHNFETIISGEMLRTRGVRSLKFLTPTPLLLCLNTLRLRSNSETF